MANPMYIWQYFVRMTELPHLVDTGCPGSFHLQRRRRKACPEIALAMLEMRLLLSTASTQTIAASTAPAAPHVPFPNFCSRHYAATTRWIK